MGLWFDLGSLCSSALDLSSGQQTNTHSQVERAKSKLSRFDLHHEDRGDDSQIPECQCFYRYYHIAPLLYIMTVYRHSQR